MSYEIIVGDCLEQLRGMEAASVQCCITSPPYFGLRDYGTGEWEGGEEDCDHSTGKGSNVKQTKHPNADGYPSQAGHRGGGGSSCLRCGAMRVDLQVGLEASPDEYVVKLVAVFAEVKRVLRDDGTLWLNLGDSYNAYNGGAGPGSKLSKIQTEARPRLSTGYGLQVKALKPKDLLMIPARVALALQADGWTLRSEVIWHKPNPMPESVTDRPTKAHEQVFLLSKSGRYFYDSAAIADPAIYAGDSVSLGEKSLSRGQATGMNRAASGNGNAASVTVAQTRNKRTVWTVATQPFTGWTKTSRRVRVAPDDAGDDTTRIASPDCPVHEGRPAPASTAPDGGHANGGPSRIPGSDDRPGQGQLVALAPTGPPHEPGSADGSSGSPLLPCEPSAIPRSSGSRRTDHAPATSPPCTPSAETPARIGDTSGSRESVAPRPDTRESNTERVGSDDPPESRTGDGTPGTSSGLDASACTCEYYRETTEETSHFATFPPKLIEPMVLAGCPREGVVLDPFAGSGTTLQVAVAHGRSAVGIELNPEYAELARRRLAGVTPSMFDLEPAA